MSFRSLHDQVLVRRSAARYKTADGIIIPETAKESRRRATSSSSATVFAAKTASSPLDVKAGDHILFSQWAGSEVTLDGETLLIMKDSDLLGVIE